MKRAIILLAVLMAGCVDTRPVEVTWTVDQCKRAELFQACMHALPAGPAATKYNDWDEVVGACEDAARYQAIRRKDQVKAECQNG